MQPFRKVLPNRSDNDNSLHAFGLFSFSFSWLLQMAAQQQDQGLAVWKAVKPFVNGGLSGMGATCIIQPIDMVKVRIQLGAKGGPVSCTACACHAPVMSMPGS